MHNQYIDPKFHELLDNAVTESFANIKIPEKPSRLGASEIKQGRLELRREVISTRDAIAKHPAFKQMVAIAHEWLAAQVEPERERLRIAQEEHREHVAKAFEKLDNSEAKYQKLMAEFADADPVTKRMQAWADTIDEVLPLIEGQQHKNGYTFDQAIRSRGLVMAALAGMTSVGAPSTKEEK